MAQPRRVLINTFFKTNHKLEIPKTLQFISIVHVLVGGNSLSVFTHLNKYERWSLISISLLWLLGLQYCIYALGLNIFIIVLYAIFLGQEILSYLSQNPMREYLIKISNIERKMATFQMSRALHRSWPLIIANSVMVSTFFYYLNLFIISGEYKFIVSIMYFYVLESNIFITSYLVGYVALKSANILTFINQRISKYSELNLNTLDASATPDSYVTSVNDLAQKIYDELMPTFMEIQNAWATLRSSKIFSILLATNIVSSISMGVYAMQRYLEGSLIQDGKLIVFYISFVSTVAMIAAPTYEMAQAFDRITSEQKVLRVQLISLASAIEIGSQERKLLKEFINAIDQNKLSVDFLRVANLDLTLAWGIVSFCVELLVTLVISVHKLTIDTI